MKGFPTDDFVNRRTNYRFDGCGLSLDLTLGLFSSAGVDSGSMLLLKTLAKETNLESLSSILDVGCGVGTLGLALAARCPDAQILMVDRDALALEFSRRNAALNTLENVQLGHRLMTEGPHLTNYDLVMSNFPAKAGDSVLQAYLASSMALLSPSGRAALVIVHTLADRCRELIEEVGGEILLTESSKQHTVFHYRPDPSGGAQEHDPEMPLTDYLRHQGAFKLKRTRYELDTVWNIGDFDSLSWRLQLMGDLLDARAFGGRMLFWSPGQGHLPVAVCKRKGARPEEIILVDRDRLALRISEHNLKKNSPEIPVKTRSLADPMLIDRTDSGEEAVDFLLTDLNPVSRSDWSGRLRAAAAANLRSGGTWAILGRSSDLAVLMKYTKGWTPTADRRNRGWRAVLLMKN